MSIKNYSTKRNSSSNVSKFIAPPVKEQSYRLDEETIKKLKVNFYKLNKWETVFYESIKTKNFKIVSAKQSKVVQSMIAKINVKLSSKQRNYEILHNISSEFSN
jgi:hypothetical protein